MIKAHLKKML